MLCYGLVTIVIHGKTEGDIFISIVFIVAGVLGIGVGYILYIMNKNL